MADPNIQGAEVAGLAVVIAAIIAGFVSFGLKRQDSSSRNLAAQLAGWDKYSRELVNRLNQVELRCMQLEGETQKCRQDNELCRKENEECRNENSRLQWRVQMLEQTKSNSST